MIEAGRPKPNKRRKGTGLERLRNERKWCGRLWTACLLGRCLSLDAWGSLLIPYPQCGNRLIATWDHMVSVYIDDFNSNWESIHRPSTQPSKKGGIAVPSHLPRHERRQGNVFRRLLQVPSSKDHSNVRQVDRRPVVLLTDEARLPLG